MIRSLPLALLLVGCGGAAIIDDDDDAPTPTGPEAPESSGVLAEAGWWGPLVLGSGLEVGRCLAAQVDNAVALGLCDIGSGRGWTYDPDAETLTGSDGLCLDGGGSAIRAEACDGGDDQRWIHDERGRLLTLVDDDWGCAHVVDRTQFPTIEACEEDADQRWAIEPQHSAVPVSSLLTGLGPLRVPVGLNPVAAVGANATPLLFSEEGTPVVVAGTAGAGRVLALGSASAIRGSDTGDSWALWWGRVLPWLGDDDTPVVGMGPDASGDSWLDDLGMTITPDVDLATASLAGIDILVVGDREGGGFDDVEMETIHTFLRDGGGLLLARSSYTADTFTAIQPQTEYRTVAAAAPAGIGWSWSTANSAATDADLTPDPDPGPFHTLITALELAGRAEQDFETLELETWQALRRDSAGPGTAGTDIPQFSRLGAATDALRRELGGLTISVDAPLDFSSGQLSDLVLRGDYVLTGGQRPGDTRSHESAATFPGPTGDGATPGEADVRIDTFAPLRAYRRSTGLYALAGSTVTVTVPAVARDIGLALRIGDALLDTMPTVGDANPSETPRFPRPWTGRRLDRETVAVATAFGGPIYVDVPEGDGAGPVTLDFAGVVGMPTFTLGETTDADWADTEAALPGARGEVVGQHIIVTASADILRLVEAPSSLAEQLDAMVEAHEEFASLTEGARRADEAGPYRIVADPRQATGLAAGHPLELADAWTRGLVFEDLQLGNESLFELLRLLGGTYRRDVWTPGPWRGAMSALAAVYAFEESTGLAGTEAWQGNLNTLTRQIRRDEWLAAEGGGWDANLETTLELFLILQDEYGWTPILEVIGDLRALPENEQPENNETKLHAWITGVSNDVGVDVVGLFQAWRFPVAEETLAATENLPEWIAWPRIPPPPPEVDP